MKLQTRRGFLKTIVIGAGTVVVGNLVGCDDDDNSTSVVISTSSEFFPQSVASGDPKMESVVLWTRVFDKANATRDLALQLQVATGNDFNNLLVDTAITTLSEHDHCVKVKVTGLTPGTSYYYRFIYQSDNRKLASRVGQTKTAPAAEVDVPVTFAFASCQDYIGHYYNVYTQLLENEVDFLVHLGNYIYETTGDPSFQASDSQRQITLIDRSSAIVIQTDETQYYAASSVDNYRDIYRTYRTDPILQAVHEKMPIIAIWDDHEYSNDCWQANATYFDGKQDENAPDRRRHAEQVWLEYMPVDLGETETGTIPILDNQLFPNNKIYRYFRFGQHLHLLMTDYRSYRPDHLIPEDAYPGTVVLDNATLSTLLATQGIDFATVKNNFAPYFNIEDAQYAAYQAVLIAATTQAYLTAGLDDATASAKANKAIQGNLDVTVVNNTLTTYNATVPTEQQLPLFTQTQIATMARGLSYLYLGKQSLLNHIGSRYGVVKNSYDLLAAARYLDSGGNSEQALGTEQEAWLTSTITNSTATWRVIGNSVSFTSLQLDFSDPTTLPAELAAQYDTVPTALRNRFYLNLDHWDAFPNKRQALVTLLDSVPNTLLIAGDIHANLVAQQGQQTYEFTGTAISSAPFGQFVTDQVVTLGLPAETAQALDNLLQLANPTLRYAKTNNNGVAIMHLDGQTAKVTYYELASEEVAVSYYEERENLQEKFIISQFTVQNGVLTTEST